MKLLLGFHWEGLPESTIGKLRHVIPSKGGSGTIYAISAIVTDSEGGGYIRYYANKAVLRPMELRSIMALKQATETINLLHGKTLFRKDLNQQISNRSSDESFPNTPIDVRFRKR